MTDHVTDPIRPFKQKAQNYYLYYRWRILALICLLYFCFGIVYNSASPLVAPIIEDLNILYSQMGLILGSWKLTYIFIALFAGVIIDKYGVKKSLFGSIVIIAFSAILRYYATGFWTLLPMVALFGIGAPLLSIGGPKVISECFSGKERGAAIGIYLASVRVGGMFALAATNSVVMPLTGFSWRLSFVCYGLFTFGAGLLWWFTVKDTPTETIKEKIPNTQILLRLMSIRTVNILIVAGLFDFAMVHGFINWLPRILEVRGMLPKVAGIAAAMPLLVSIPSIILIPRYIPAHSRGRSLAILAVLSSIAFIMVTLPAVPSIVGLLLFGFTGPTLLPLMVLILMDVPKIGAAYMGSAVGIYFCACEIGGIIGPFLMGFFFDIFESFVVGACFLAALGLIIAAMTFPLKMQK